MSYPMLAGQLAVSCTEAREAEHEAQQQRTVGALNWPKDLLQFC